MKIKVQKGDAFSIDKGCHPEHISGQHVVYLDSPSKNKLIKLITLLMILFCFSAHAQTNPASAITGLLKARVNGGNTFITCEVSETNPVITYSFETNTSGATIVTTGSYIYDSTTGIGKQTIEVNPGSAAGSFTIKAEVTTPNGRAESSMSVTVVK